MPLAARLNQAETIWRKLRLLQDPQVGDAFASGQAAAISMLPIAKPQRTHANKGLSGSCGLLACSQLRSS